MTHHLHVVRVAPCDRYLRRRIRNSLRRLAENLAWCTLDPAEDTPVVLGHAAGVTNLILEAQGAAIIAKARSRAERLQESGSRDDLVAAAELNDFAADLEDDLSQTWESRGDADL